VNACIYTNTGEVWLRGDDQQRTLLSGQELVMAFFDLNSNFNSSAEGAQLNGQSYNGGTRRAATTANATVAPTETPATATNATDTSSSNSSSSSSSSAATTLGVVEWHTGDFELDRLYANYLACPR
jgi:hypothetical protein